jgi:adenine-specific DNA-methyltransferase
MEQEARDSECLTFLENINDGLVRELYNPTELHERGIHVAQLVMTARLPSVSSVETPEELKAIRTKLDEAYDIESPLRAALFDLVSLTMSEEAGS